MPQDSPLNGADDDLGASAPLSKAARLEYIKDAVTSQGFVNVDDLVQALGVSRMTVHRDLDALQESGALRKVRGGASAHRSTKFESDLHYRKMAAMDEKRKIAKAAAELSGVGDVVIIDDSTTALEVIPHLGPPPMTVISNFLPALKQLCAMPKMNVISLGGEFVAQYAAFFGIICEENLKGLRADVLFASTSSLNGNMLYHQDQRVVAVKRAMIASAERRVLLIDHTKVGQTALYRLCEVNEFTHVVVSDRVADSQVKALEELGVTVIVA
ncbi:MAG: DeoR/GlpR family DNA-binding transcription regulator [Brachybacterium sp.]|uniref:DeoR/GlpR family DNA-binding transcription regulator n=1 Tax=Brachybacterium sp. TaxID=1891286 RepID=UPI003F91217B